MKRRAERQQDFEGVKQTLLGAGVSVLKAAQAQEQMFRTSLETIAEVMEMETPAQQLTGVVDGSGANLLYEALIVQRQAAESQGNFEGYMAVETKLQQLEELEVQRYERQARLLEAQVRIQTAQAQLAQPEPLDKNSNPVWTEATLKQTYKTLNAVQKAFGVQVSKWRDAVAAVNQVVAKQQT